MNRLLNMTEPDTKNIIEIFAHLYFWFWSNSFKIYSRNFDDNI